MIAKNNFCLYASTVLICMLYACLLVGCVPSTIDTPTSTPNALVSPSPVITTPTKPPDQIVVIQIHIKGNQASVVDLWKTSGYSSNLDPMGELQVIVYSSDNATVLQDFFIQDPRQGIPYENFKDQILTSFTDDIDFYIEFPNGPNLGKLVLLDYQGEVLLTVDLREINFR